MRNKCGCRNSKVQTALLTYRNQFCSLIGKYIISRSDRENTCLLAHKCTLLYREAIENIITTTTNIINKYYLL